VHKQAAASQRAAYRFEQSWVSLAFNDKAVQITSKVLLPCVCMYVGTCVGMFVCVFICLFVCIRMHGCMCIAVVDMYIAVNDKAIQNPLYVHLFDIYAHIYIHIYMFICLFVCIRMHGCMYIAVNDKAIQVTSKVPF